MDTLRFYSPPDLTYQSYQRYYTLGLQALPDVRLIQKPYGLGPDVLSRLLSIPLLQKLLPGSAPDPDFCPSAEPYVGQYIYQPALGKSIRFAIDSHDHHQIRSQEILNWCDVYFKANCWRDVSYPAKVRPIVNGNGVLNASYISLLRSLRTAPKTTDLVFVSRIWGGIEHNVLLFEQIARVPGQKVLTGILSGKDDLPPEILARLKNAGVPWTHQLEHKRALWKQLASARLVVLRAGKHLCIPWRMIDLLCMGACIVMDSTPYPVWPAPLIEGQNFFSLGITRPANTDPGLPEEYAQIPQRVNAMLQDPAVQEQIRQANARYFDEHASPIAVARYIQQTLNSLL